MSRAACCLFACGLGIALFVRVWHLSPGLAPQAGHSKSTAFSMPTVYAELIAVKGPIIPRESVSESPCVGREIAVSSGDLEESPPQLAERHSPSESQFRQSDHLRDILTPASSSPAADPTKRAAILSADVFSEALLTSCILRGLHERALAMSAPALGRRRWKPLHSASCSF